MSRERQTYLLGALIALPLTALCLPAAAQDARKELHETMEHIESSTARNKELSEQYAKLNSELSSMQKDLIEMAGKMQRDEAALSALEKRQDALEQQKASKRDTLATQQARLARVTQAIIQLSQTPEEAVIAMPGEYPDMMRTARVLGLATASLREEAEALQSQLSELNRLQKKIEDNKEKLRVDRHTLDAQRLLMDTQLKSRKKLQLEVYSARQKEAETLAQLSKKSSNLQDLIRSIETQEEQERIQRQTPKSIASTPVRSSPATAHKPLRSFSSAKGRIKWPAEGTLAGRYGAKKNRNETYKGLMLDTRDNAQVTAPYDGEVVFAGPFMAYGRIVILRHSGDFHTLLAGLNRIDCVPGQFLLEGEPVGVMGTKKQGENNLYIELRQENRPVDPSPWMAGMMAARNG